MNYLIDTHVLLWIVNDENQLSRKAGKMFLDAKNKIYVSTASIWEMAIKISLDKLSIPGKLPEFVEKHIIANNILILPVELKHLYKLENMPFYHRDPFARLLIAQSIVENIDIISSDTHFDHYPVNRVW